MKLLKLAEDYEGTWRNNEATRHSAIKRAKQEVEYLLMDAATSNLELR